MPREFHILLIEDSRADVKIIERTLAEGNIGHRLTVVPDGRQALDYFKRLEDLDLAGELQPDLVLLDLNLPDIDGCQILTQLKTHPVLRSIPIVVLTTSRREEDIIQTYQAGANSFICKPDEYPRYRDLVKTLQVYWHETVLGPPLRAQREP